MRLPEPEAVQMFREGRPVQSREDQQDKGRKLRRLQGRGTAALEDQDPLG